MTRAEHQHLNETLGKYFPQQNEATHKIKLLKMVRYCLELFLIFFIFLLYENKKNSLKNI